MGKTLEALDKKKSQIENLPENERFMNAKDGEKIVGVCRLVKGLNENELRAIYILSQYRGKGIGSMFWNEAVKFFNDDKDIIIWVAPYNEKAIEFYKKLGFSDTGEVYSDKQFTMRNGSVIPEKKMVLSRKGL